MATRIKVCGLKYKENTDAVLSLRPDMVGFNFYPKSKRYVSPEEMKELNKLNFRGIPKVGVFVNEDVDVILEIVKTFGLEYVQLHGKEFPDQVRYLQRRTSVIKAFGIATKADFDHMKKYYNETAYMFLLDNFTPAFGGSGKPFDWDLLKHYKCTEQYLLAGGISSETIGEALTIEDYHLYGLDLNSGYEISPGLKDIEKLNRLFDFFHAIQG